MLIEKFNEMLERKRIKEAENYKKSLIHLYQEVNNAIEKGRDYVSSNDLLCYEEIMLGRIKGFYQHLCGKQITAKGIENLEKELQKYGILEEAIESIKREDPNNA